MSVKQCIAWFRDLDLSEWLTLIGLAVGGPIFCCMVVPQMFGTPYLRQGSRYCHIDPSSALVRWLPPVTCGYVGMAGTRSLSFSDAEDCPPIVILPPRIDRPQWQPLAPRPARRPLGPPPVSASL